MSQRLIVFISSTVEDLDGVRRQLRDQLAQREIEVRLSEDPDFPVEPGVTSHDACLRAVREAHIFVLLVSCRFGGEYQAQNKSITWREWEEAMDAGLLPIVLVDRRANNLARAVFRRRRELVAEHPEAQVVEIDRLLRAEPELADEKPDRHNLPGVQRFIDTLRKGHVDNWMHADWDGTATEAMRRIDARLSTALAVARSQQRPVREVAERERLRTDAIHQIASGAASLSIAVQTRRVERDKAVDLLLQLWEGHRQPLLGFREGDRHNFVVYLRDGDLLWPAHRASHPSIPTHGRTWKIGQGHVGLAVEKNQLLVSGDIRHTAAWVPADARPADGSHYVSAVSVPFSHRTPTDDPEGALIVTSSRLDHFTSPSQVDVLSIGTLVNILTMLLNAGERAS